MSIHANDTRNDLIIKIMVSLNYCNIDMMKRQKMRNYLEKQSNNELITLQKMDPEKCSNHLMKLVFNAPLHQNTSEPIPNQKLLAAPRKSTNFYYAPEIKEKFSISPQRRDRVPQKQEGYPIGFKNISNICYLNTILQTFFHIPNLVETIQYIDFEDKQVNRDFQQKKIYYPFHMTKCLQELFHKMSNESDAYQNPSNLQKFLTNEQGNPYDFGEHRDVLEFMSNIISSVQIFIKEYKQIFEKYQNENIKKLLTFDLNFLKGEFVEDDAESKGEITQSQQNLKKGDLESILINCIPDKNIEEQIDLSLTTRVGKIYKKKWITKAPGILAIQICRFTYENGEMKKQNNMVPIELEIDLGNHLYKNSVVSTKLKHKEEEVREKKKEIQDQKSHLECLVDFYQTEGQNYEVAEKMIEKLKFYYEKCDLDLQNMLNELIEIKKLVKPKKYKQFSIIIHEGTLNHGHYYCYIKKGKEWFLCNDMVVTGGISENEVITHGSGNDCSSSNGYVLFYLQNEFIDVESLSDRVNGYQFLSPVGLTIGHGQTPTPMPISSPNKATTKEKNMDNIFGEDLYKSPQKNVSNKSPQKKIIKKVPGTALIIPEPFKKQMGYQDPSTIESIFDFPEERNFGTCVPVSMLAPNDKFFDVSDTKIKKKKEDYLLETQFIPLDQNHEFNSNQDSEYDFGDDEITSPSKNASNDAFNNVEGGLKRQNNITPDLSSTQFQQFFNKDNPEITHKPTDNTCSIAKYIVSQTQPQTIVSPAKPKLKPLLTETQTKNKFVIPLNKRPTEIPEPKITIVNQAKAKPHTTAKPEPPISDKANENRQQFFTRYQSIRQKHLTLQQNYIVKKDLDAYTNFPYFLIKCHKSNLGIFTSQDEITTIQNYTSFRLVVQSFFPYNKNRWPDKELQFYKNKDNLIMNDDKQSWDDPKVDYQYNYLKTEYNKVFFVIWLFDQSLKERKNYFINSSLRRIFYYVTDQSLRIDCLDKVAIDILSYYRSILTKFFERDDIQFEQNYGLETITEAIEDIIEMVNVKKNLSQKKKNVKKKLDAMIKQFSHERWKNDNCVIENVNSWYAIISVLSVSLESGFTNVEDVSVFCE